MSGHEFEHLSNLGKPPVSTYDRRRLLDEEVVPPKLGSLRSVTWEHQAEAMRLGYRSVLEYAVDKMIDEVTDLKARVAALEEGR